MRVFVCLTLCVLAVLAADPPRPQIPRTFETKAAVQIQHNNATTLDGEGHWIYDLHGNRAVEFFYFHDDRSQDIFRLQRYDLEKDFVIHFESSNRTCDVQKVSGNMPDEFTWINNASFIQTKDYKGHVLDIWQLTVGYATMTIAVNHHRTNEPIFYARQTPNFVFHIEFIEFKPIKPRDSWFVVPSKCESSEPSPRKLGCVARSTMIARAQSWVDAHVPYNQQGDYGGYREDCSGYVSMAWETVQPGYTTETLPEVAHPISKGELAPGDVLLCETDHVVLFGGWANSDQSYYVAFEETRPGEGTVTRNDPYPYFYNTACFKPYRFNSVC